MKKYSRENFTLILGRDGLGLGLAEISPVWNQRLSALPVSFPYRIRWYLDMHHKRNCVVGEAYGFSSGYSRLCNECDRLSVDFESYFMGNQVDELEATKEEFVAHWNKRHQNVSSCLDRKKKTSRWHDNFLRFDDHIQTVTGASKP